MCNWYAHGGTDRPSTGAKPVVPLVQQCSSSSICFLHRSVTLSLVISIDTQATISVDPTSRKCTPVTGSHTHAHRPHHCTGSQCHRRLTFDCSASAAVTLIGHSTSGHLAGLVCVCDVLTLVCSVWPLLFAVCATGQMSTGQCPTEAPYMSLIVVGSHRDHSKNGLPLSIARACTTIGPGK